MHVVPIKALTTHVSLSIFNIYYFHYSWGRGYTIFHKTKCIVFHCVQATIIKGSRLSNVFDIVNAYEP